MLNQRIQSSISLKLLIAFLVIIVLSLASMMLTLNALNKTREAQNRLTEEALPLLRVSKSFSQALFEYLYLLKQASIPQADQADLLVQIIQHEQDIQSHIDHLWMLNRGAIDITAIAALLDHMLSTSSEMRSLVFEQRPHRIAAVDDGVELIRQHVVDIRRQIRRHRIISRTHHAEPAVSAFSVDDELANVDQILAQYHYQTNTETLKSFQSRYIVATRRMTQKILLVPDPVFKEQMAKGVNQLFNHAVDQQGFFVQALALSHNVSRALAIIDDTKRKEQEINVLLSRLMQDVTEKADVELRTFDSLIQRNIITFIMIMITSVIVSAITLYGYVIPKITRRLDQLASDTQQIASGAYDAHINTRGTDEIAQMANALDGFKHALIAKEKTEAEREKLVNKLMDSNEELQRFAFVCSHDLQEPLRMIRSFSDKLKQHMGNRFDDDEKGKKYFRFITEGAERAQNLIADILACSSISSDPQALEAVDCEKLVRTVKNNLFHCQEEQTARITFDALPVVRGNKTQLFQLFQNVINNAVKYQPPDNLPQVHIGIEDKEHYWQFSITDNGIGMEERHFKKIFDVFQRLHRKSEYAGTGVGLSICKKVVERHGGKIWVTSNKGVGSVFYFTLPKIMKNEDTDS